ncbi:MAG: aminotransferase class V-fold PLP-dependent enzyme [Deltaproteobacteria bacterium]|nr:aminotransferase class V-fold PLP-dependent enzyme [Deltaproteobacteria bacterium]
MWTPPRALPEPPCPGSPGIHLLSLSAHKVHGPKGVGALVRCRDVPLEPLLHGGGQEAGLRSGTENPFAVVAFCHAARQVEQRHRAMQAERAVYHARLLEALESHQRLRVFRSPHQLPFFISFSLPEIPGEVTLHHLEQEGLLVSTGSACSTSSPEPSRVLLATGIDRSRALGAIRMSFSIHNTLAGLEKYVLPALDRALKKLERA